jgi:hypothetical protein
MRYVTVFTIAVTPLAMLTRCSRARTTIALAKDTGMMAQRALQQVGELRLPSHSHSGDALSGPIRLVRIGEPDGELRGAGGRARQGPIQLAWMVNKIRVDRLAYQSPSPSRQAGWGRGTGDEN